MVTRKKDTAEIVDPVPRKRGRPAGSTKKKTSASKTASKPAVAKKTASKAPAAGRSSKFSLNFGEALAALKEGKKVTRKGWNGKKMWLVFVPGTQDVKLAKKSPYFKAGLTQVNINAHIDMYTAQGTMQPGWLASQTDMLAEDWGVVD